MKIIRAFLYITCSKKIVFVKMYLSLLWVVAEFSIFLVATITDDDDDDDDDGDMMIAHWLRWGDELEWRCKHCDAVIGYWPSDETGEGSSRSFSSGGAEGWADENVDG
jgi:hypothetical protein